MAAAMRSTCDAWSSPKKLEIALPILLQKPGPKSDNASLSALTPAAAENN